MEKPTLDPWLLEYNNILRDNDSVYRSAAKKLNIPESTLWILYSFRAESRPITQSYMCSLLHQPKQTVNTALKQLEAQGCISLCAGGDRRTKEISLTEKGEALAQITADKIIAAEEQAFEDMSSKEKETLLALLKKINLLLRQASEKLL